MNKRHIHEHICTSYLHTSLPYTPTPTNLTPTHNQSYKRTYTLHTYPTYLHCPYKPTKPRHPVYLPHIYIPTLPLHPSHPTLHACPIITHHLQEQAVSWCGSVLPVMKYYVLRNLLAKLLHFSLISLLRASCRRKG